MTVQTTQLGYKFPGPRRTVFRASFIIRHPLGVSAVFLVRQTGGPETTTMMPMHDRSVADTFLRRHRSPTDFAPLLFIARLDSTRQVHTWRVLFRALQPERVSATRFYGGDVDKACSRSAKCAPRNPRFIRLVLIRFSARYRRETRAPLVRRLNLSGERHNFRPSILFLLLCLGHDSDTPTCCCRKPLDMLIAPAIHMSRALDFFAKTPVRRFVSSLGLAPLIPRPRAQRKGPSPHFPPAV